MRTLTSGLLTAQKGLGVTGAVYDAIWKIILSRSGQTTRGYDLTRVMQIQHNEADESQIAQVLLDNTDGALTSLDFEQFQGIIYYGYNTAVARTAWAANTAYSVGDYVKPTTANGYQYRCTVAGTSHLTIEPTWGTALGVTQTDGTVTWEMDGNLGDEYSPTAPLKVTGQEFISSQTQLVCRLYLIGLPNQLDQDRAIAKYTPTSSDTTTCKTLAGKIADASINLNSAYNGYPVITDTYDSEDNLLNSFYPADYFSISINATRKNKLMEVVGYTATKVRAEDDGELHFFVPRKLGTTWAVSTAYTINDYVQPTTPNNNFLYRCTTAGTSHGSAEPAWPTVAGNTVNDNGVIWTAVDFDYEYRFEIATYHTFFSKNLRSRFVDPNKIIVASPSSHSPTYTGNATSATSYALAPKIKTINKRLVSNASATSIAKAMIEQLELRAERGSAVVPMNCGQEVFDCVKFTDASEGDVRIGNILSLQRNCKTATDTSDGQFDMLLRFGDVNDQSIGASFGETSIAPIGIKEIEAIADNVAKWWMLQLEKSILELFDDYVILLEPKTIVFSVAGNLVVGNNASFEIPAPVALIIDKVYINVRTAPTGTAIIVDFNIGGTSIFATTQGNRPTIAVSETAAESGAPDTTAWAKNAIGSIDIDQIGSTIAGADLVVEIRCKVA